MNWRFWLLDCLVYYLVMNCVTTAVYLCCFHPPFRPVTAADLRAARGELDRTAASSASFP
jgi:hypothetical protein